MASDKTPSPPPRRLGRGLDALFSATPAAHEEPDSALQEIPLGEIRSNPFQPRKNFNADELRELQESLDTSGLLQPIAVRKRPRGDGYELVAGERRLRAAIDLGWTTISAIVKDLDDRQLLGLALVENLQRTDLNPIEEAEGYERLISEFGHTQQSVASLVGRDRSTIANMLRVLQLPPAVRQMVREGVLTVGHARPLLALGDNARMVELAQEIIKKGLTAREIEQRVRESPRAKTSQKRGRPQRLDSRPVELRNLEDKLRRYLQTDVAITATPHGKGSVKVSFYSTEDLERITDLIGLTRDPQ
ncbi:MAG: ParB/RepB/Spo0J family partition protein [Terriglobia bacterium]